MKTKMKCKECNCRMEYSYSCMCWYCPDCTEKQVKAEDEVLDES